MVQSQESAPASSWSKLNLTKLLPLRLKLESPEHKNGSRIRPYAQITGWGRYVPPNVMTNHEVSRMVETSDEWIRERTGIRERHIAGPKEWTSTMALRAARSALAVAGVSPAKVDAVVCATSTPDYPAPPSGCIIQGELGATNAAAFDVMAGCSGFLYALVVANGLIAAGTHHTVLVIGADTLSRVTDWTDRTTCVLFADGAGAVVMQASDTPTGIISSTLGADGLGGDFIIIPGGGSRTPASHETVDKRMHYIKMSGREVFKFAVTKVVKATHQVVAEAGWQLEDIDLIIPHQANLRIIQAAAKGLKLPEERFFVNIDRYGNNSAATIPIAITEAVEAGRIKQGDNLVLVGFGAGLTWGAVAMQWGAPRIAPKRTAWQSVNEELERGRLKLRRTARKFHPRYWL